MAWSKVSARRFLKDSIPAPTFDKGGGHCLREEYSLDIRKPSNPAESPALTTALLCSETASLEPDLAF